jgi:hypothetical protein
MIFLIFDIGILTCKYLLSNSVCNQISRIALLVVVNNGVTSRAIVDAVVSLSLAAILERWNAVLTTCYLH